MKLLEYSDSFLVLSMHSTDAMIYSRTYTGETVFSNISYNTNHLFYIHPTEYNYTKM